MHDRACGGRNDGIIVARDAAGFAGKCGAGTAAGETGSKHCDEEKQKQDARARFAAKAEASEQETG
jgi:hypothetical protein